MFYSTPYLRKTITLLAFFFPLTACVTSTNQSPDVFGHQQRDLRAECLRALRWRQQQNLDGLFDDDASEGDRLVSAIVYSNTNEAEERLKCEGLGLSYTVEGVPEKPRSKKDKTEGQ